MSLESLYEFGEYRLDATRRLLSHAQTGLVPVTGRAFDTLLYLVQNPGRLVSKRELMKAVWEDAVVEENNLTQAVSVLRQVLGERPGEHRYIVTESRRGYRFIAPVRQTGPAGGEETSPSPAAAAQDEPAALRPDATGHRRPLYAGIALLALLAITVAALPWERWIRAEPAIRTIAVLPFKPLLPDQGDPVLEMGMADTLITRLGISADIVVRPLSSVRGYTGLEQNPIVAGRKLGADAVLDGSIHRHGDAVRVTTRLIRVRDGVTIWVNEFDGPWTDVFTVQDSIAEHMVGTLALTLTSEERARLARRNTDSSEAYRLYLLGRFHWLKLTPPEIERSIDYFQRAVQEDESYALAHAGLAEAYRSLAITSDRRPADVLPQGKAAALKALEIDDRLDTAQASLCFIETWWDWDWPAAERSCKRALQINPNSADGHRAYAILLSNLGRHEQAIVHAKRASELEPLALITTAIEAHVLHYAGRNDEAIERLEATLELDPDFWIARLFTGKILLEAGQLDAALHEFERAERLSGGNSETVSMIGFTRAQAGDRDGARRAIEELRARQPERYVPPFNIAMIYHGLGDESETLTWLERAYEERDVRLTFLKVERKWDPIRSDPRFQALAARMRLGT